MIKIGIASDHSGFTLKEELIHYLEKTKKYTLVDVGTKTSISCNYAIYAHHLSMEVESGMCSFGIVICGSGNGVSMTCNKHQNIRCALCWNPEIATLARAHNDANICALPARFITLDNAIEIVESFISTEYEGGRHEARVSMISNY